MFTVQRLRGEGRQRPRLLQRVLCLAAECLYFLFLFSRDSSHSSPPGPNKHLASHTAKPGSLPRILQHTLHPGQGFSCPGPCAGPRDLIVLKHSSYCQIFQCPLSLVSDLHICWNIIGCLLCSSDQLGVSLVPRGSELCSHLSCRHLPAISKPCHFKYDVSQYRPLWVQIVWDFLSSLDLCVFFLHQIRKVFCHCFFK